MWLPNVTLGESVLPWKGSKHRLYNLINYSDENVKGTWYFKNNSQFEKTSTKQKYINTITIKICTKSGEEFPIYDSLVNCRLYVCSRPFLA